MTTVDRRTLILGAASLAVAAAVPAVVAQPHEWVLVSRDGLKARKDARDIRHAAVDREHLIAHLQRAEWVLVSRDGLKALVRGEPYHPSHAGEDYRISPGALEALMTSFVR